MGLIGTLLGFVQTVLYWVLVKPAAMISTTRYRWVIIVPFVLPMSLVYYWFTYLRAKIFFTLNTGPKAHDAKVQAVIASVRPPSTLLAPLPLNSCFHLFMTSIIFSSLDLSPVRGWLELTSPLCFFLVLFFRACSRLAALAFTIFFLDFLPIFS